MFDVLKRLVGYVEVTEVGSKIVCAGIHTDQLRAAIVRHYDTTIVGKWIFSEFSSARIVFEKFFAVEVVYILKDILATQGLPYYLRVSLDKLILELETKTWLVSRSTEHPPILDRGQLARFKIRPLPPQLGYFDVLDKQVPRYRLFGYALGMPPGTGKTYTMMAAAEMLHPILRIIVSPMNAIRDVWVRTYETELGLTPFVSADSTDIDLTNPVHVYHYEKLQHAVDMLIQFRRKHPTGRIAIILDESHNLNEWDSMRTQLFMKLVELATPNRTLDEAFVQRGSGTLMKAMGSEAIPLLASYDPFVNDEVRLRIRKIFGKDAIRGTDVLRHRMGIATYTIPKTDVRPEPAPPVVIKVAIDNASRYTMDTIRADIHEYMRQRLDYYRSTRNETYARWNAAMQLHVQGLRSPMQHKAFQEYRAQLDAILKGFDPVAHKQAARLCNSYELTVIIPSLPAHMREDFKKDRSVVKYVRLVVVGEALGNVLGKRRIEAATAIASKVDIAPLIESAEKKTLIFSSYVSTLSILNDRLKSDFKPIVMHGGTSKDLGKLLDTFRDDKLANPVLATYALMSTAVPMTTANAMIAINLPDRDYIYKQAISRIDRLGQDAPVRLYQCELDTGTAPNVTDHSKSIMEWSAKMVDAYLGVDGVDATMLDTLTCGFINNSSDAVVPLLKRIQKALGLDAF